MNACVSLVSSTCPSLGFSSNDQISLCDNDFQVFLLQPKEILSRRGSNEWDIVNLALFSIGLLPLLLTTNLEPEASQKKKESGFLLRT